MALWDISPPLRLGIPVWPGDTAFAAERSWQLDDACPVNVSRITLSTHTGAHADAPLHYDAAGVPVGGLDLERYLGPCRVVHAIGVRPLIHAGDVLDGLPAGTTRLLIRTYRQAPQERWDPDFAAIDMLMPHPCTHAALGVHPQPEQGELRQCHQASPRRGS